MQRGDLEDHGGPRAMSMSDGMAGAEDVSQVAQQTGMQHTLKMPVPGLLVLVLDLKQIMNHPQMCFMISDEGKVLLMYMICLGLSHPQSNCKLIFSFCDNPNFWNTVIVEEYYHDIIGVMAYCSTPVHWFWNYVWGAPSLSLDTSSLNFLNWLSTHNFPASIRTAK
ncbi:unnamed protein product, partial [Rangifer tarandus platyrhynchus]